MDGKPTTSPASSPTDGRKLSNPQIHIKIKKIKKTNLTSSKILILVGGELDSRSLVRCEEERLREIESGGKKNTSL